MDLEAKAPNTGNLVGSESVFFCRAEITDADQIFSDHLLFYITTPRLQFETCCESQLLRSPWVVNLGRSFLFSIPDIGRHV